MPSYLRLATSTLTCCAKPLVVMDEFEELTLAWAVIDCSVRRQKCATAGQRTITRYGLVGEECMSEAAEQSGGGRATAIS